VLDDSLPKYINSPVTPIFDKSSSLYGINLAAAAIRQQNLVVMVEGYMDVITAHQNGFNNVVASMGTAVTEKQVGALKRLTKNVALALDADAAGEEAMLRGVGYENILDAEVKVIIMPKGKDPDDVIKEDAKIWQSLLEEASPIVDYTFNVVTSKLDLTTARDESLAVESLAPIVVEIKNPVRQAHYIQKLARLVGKSERTIEAALSRIKPSQARRPIKEPKPEAVAHALQPLLSSPIEGYCLSLLLQHPELKASDRGLSAEYFENSENREIFTAWQRVDTLPSLKDRLDGAIWEHLDSLIAKSLPNNQIEQRYNNCVLRLQEKFLRSLEAKREEVLALEAKSGGTAAELAKLEEQGIEVSVQLGKVFTQKIQRQSGTKR
jgi:DNA primase